MNVMRALCMTASMALLAAAPAGAGSPFFFNTGLPDGLIGTASRPDAGGKIEIESADDFLLNSSTLINHATFTGLLANGATVPDIQDVRVEIYRVFPLDSTNPPSGNVPTRNNSPSDVALDERSFGGGTLSFTGNNLGNFAVANSVLNGINPKPGQTTGGEGPVSGTETSFDVTLKTPLVLPAGHYFFIPQVQLANGDFFWLSAPKPISGGGTTPFSPDLQSWIRNANLDPDWLRIGTDVIGPPATGGPAPTFNAAFSLSGTTVPEPSTWLLLGSGLAGLWAWRRTSA